MEFRFSRQAFFAVVKVAVYREVLCRYLKESLFLKYSITDESGQLVDQSQDGKPWVFIHGLGQMLKGVERALLGHVEGDHLQIVVAPEDGEV